MSKDGCIILHCEVHMLGNHFGVGSSSTIKERICAPDGSCATACLNCLPHRAQYPFIKCNLSTSMPPSHQAIHMLADACAD